MTHTSLKPKKRPRHSNRFDADAMHNTSLHAMSLAKGDGSANLDARERTAKK